mmetsp:Transcript_108970/g.308159  ORF Transcript_108970/g.308159 Transcript_108970/m.308159 type:complete len:228 (-) Transcript_108970:71-754(-)
MPHIAWAASQREGAQRHGRGGSADVWLLDAQERVETHQPGLVGPQPSLLEAVRSCPRGRWRPPPRPLDPSPSESSQIDHYGTSRLCTISGEVVHEGPTGSPPSSSSGQRFAFSRKELGGPELPTFRNTETAYTPRAQKQLRRQLGANPRNPPQGSSAVQEVIRKLTQPLDPYKVFTRKTVLQDRGRSLCFRQQPAYENFKGQDNLDMVMPGVKSLGLAPRQPPSMRP